MAQKKKPTKAAPPDDKNIKSDEDGRSWYTAPEGWEPCALREVEQIAGAAAPYRYCGGGRIKPLVMLWRC